VRTLVIGGTRNLGPRLVGALLARGDSVSVLNRGLTAPGGVPATGAAGGPAVGAAGGLVVGAGGEPATGAAGGPATGAAAGSVQRLVADRSDPQALEESLHGLSFDLVVDTTLYTGRDAETIARVLDGRTGRYVWWSTGQVYLVREGIARPFRETDYAGPTTPEPSPPHTLDHRNWIYGYEKRLAEDALAEAHARRGFPTVSLRMPMIASETDHYTRIAAYVRRMLDGGPILVTREPAAPVRHVYGGDVIAATLAAGAAGTASAESVIGRAFNISQDETLTLEAMLAAIAECVETSTGERHADRPARVAVPELVALPRAELERHGVLPTCSPFSDPWMSSLANEASTRVLGPRYTRVAEYLPRCVDAALALAPERIVGYERRAEEIALAEGRLA